MATLSAEQIFHSVREMSSEKREGYLAAACGDDLALRTKVEGLLAADVEAGRFMETLDAADAAMRGATLAAPVTPSAERPGQLLGRYKLLQQIGEGGFGAVWMAEQREPVKRRVALKIIKLGMDTRQVIARFEAERQALAMMDHPNIAKVLDAGATEAGRPYFVMEYIRGVPILDYCDTEKLDTRARLRLFAQVCRAIQHAHQKGVIHRDIKPSNVLITLHDGVPVPKVIDFGIAKATNHELTDKTLFTRHQQMIGTPAYMSPEQAEMSGLDIDTRSDIYSLGVLLYELLTGTTPFAHEELTSKGYAEMMRVIREVEPHKPSARLSTLGETATLTAQRRHLADPARLGIILRGDLDWIVMKCLEKDRTRRYETANGLAADIQRHLNDEPVVAGPPSARYRLRKLIRRNKGAFIGAAAVFLVLILGVIGTGAGLIAALDARKSEAEQRRVAEERFAAAQQYVETIADEVYPGIRPLIGASEPLAAMTRATSKFLDDLSVDASDSPALRLLTVRMLIRRAAAQGSYFAANTAGDFRLSLQSALRARALFATLPKNYPDVRTYFNMYYDIEDSIAASQSLTGDPRQALETYLTLEAFCEEYMDSYPRDRDDVESADEDPATRDWGLDLLNFRIGHVYGALGDYESQLKRYEASALPVIASGINIETDSKWAVHELSVCHAILSNALENLGRNEEALEHIGRALEISQMKVHRWPNDARFARDLVSTTARYALLSARLGHTDNLAELVDEALRAGQALVARDPSNGAFRDDYLSAILDAGEAYELASDSATGQRRIELLRRATELWSLACDDQPTANQDMVSPGRDRVAEARAKLTEAKALLDQLESRSEVATND